jgi:hypothetical protein
MMRIPFFRAGYLMLVLGLGWLSISPAWAQFQDADAGRALQGRAVQIWRALPPDARLAIRPVQGDEVGLPNDVASALDTAILRALDRVRPVNAVVLPRADLRAVFEEAEAFSGADPARLLSQVSATALLIPRVTPTREGVHVAMSLLSVGASEFGSVLATPEPVVLRFDIERARARSPTVAGRQAAHALAEAVRAAIAPSEAVAASVRLDGVIGAFADWFAGEVAEHLVSRLAERPLYVARTMRAMDAAPRAANVTLRLEVWDLGSRVDVTVTALTEGETVRTVARIAKARIPQAFLPLTRDGGRVADGMIRAAGIALSGHGMQPSELRLAARMVARARLVDRALGGSESIAETARDRADVAAAMVRLEQAIPFEEILKDGGGPADRRADITARFERVGGRAAPRLEAQLDRAVYRPGLPIRVRVRTGDTTSLVAMFALQADGTVLRIAPRSPGAPRELPAKREIMLPTAVDGEISSAPLPGMRENLEAIVLIASSASFEPADLAPAAGESAEESTGLGVPVGVFLDRLSKLDLARVSLKIMPYRVRADVD